MCVIQQDECDGEDWNVIEWWKRVQKVCFWAFGKLEKTVGWVPGDEQRKVQEKNWNRWFGEGLRLHPVFAGRAGLEVPVSASESCLEDSVSAVNYAKVSNLERVAFLRVQAGFRTARF